MPIAKSTGRKLRESKRKRKLKKKAKKKHTPKKSPMTRKEFNNKHWGKPMWNLP